MTIVATVIASLTLVITPALAIFYLLSANRRKKDLLELEHGSSRPHGSRVLHVTKLGGLVGISEWAALAHDYAHLHGQITSLLWPAGHAEEWELLSLEPSDPESSSPWIETKPALARRYETISARAGIHRLSPGHQAATRFLLGA